jgi:16S rRNA (cytosine967-C5)-methyltransferase
LDDALTAASQTTPLDARDRRLAYEITAGCLRNKTLLEWHLQHGSTRPLDRAAAPVRWALLMGAYQLLFLDRVGAHAAVHQAVEQCKRHSRNTAAFANAVLRALQRRSAAPPTPAPALPAEDHLRFSHPAWLVNLYRALAPTRYRDILTWNNSRCIHYARVRRALPEVLRALGAIAEPAPEFGPDVLRLLDTSAVVMSHAFACGDLYIMQPWSQRAAGMLPLRAGWRVLDMCAAPGGKTIAIADRDAVHITALEFDARRADALRANLQRCRLSSVAVHIMDARLAAAQFGAAAFDAVLVDAPCSNLGVIQRHPEVRWRVQPDDLPRLAATQLTLLRTARQCVRPGGFVLYAVCTIAPDETDAVIHATLQASPDLRLQTRELTLPGDGMCDGGYWALLQRTD